MSARSTLLVRARPRWTPGSGCVDPAGASGPSRPRGAGAEPGNAAGRGRPGPRALSAPPSCVLTGDLGCRAVSGSRLWAGWAVAGALAPRFRGASSLRGGGPCSVTFSPLLVVGRIRVTQGPGLVTCPAPGDTSVLPDTERAGLASAALQGRGARPDTRVSVLQDGVPGFQPVLRYCCLSPPPGSAAGRVGPGPWMLLRPQLTAEPTPGGGRGAAVEPGWP